MKDINLLPEEVKSPGSTNSFEAVKTEKKHVSAAGVFITVFVLLIMGASLVAPKAYLIYLEGISSGISQQLDSKAYQEVNMVNAQAAQLGATVEEKGAILAAIDAKSLPMAEILNAIRRSTPKGCVVSELKIEKGGLSITGYSESSLLVAELMSNLDRLESFSRLGKTDSVTYDRTNSSQKFVVNYTVGGKEGK